MGTESNRIAVSEVTLLRVIYVIDAMSPDIGFKIVRPTETQSLIKKIEHKRYALSYQVFFTLFLFLCFIYDYFIYILFVLFFMNVFSVFIFVMNFSMNFLYTHIIINCF